MALGDYFVNDVGVRLDVIDDNGVTLFADENLVALGLGTVDPGEGTQVVFVPLLVDADGLYAPAVTGGAGPPPSNFRYVAFRI
jgi:hypothetical protein